MTRKKGGAMVGVVGGDHLGVFFVRAAHRLGFRAAVLDPNPAAPGHQEADLAIKAAYDDKAALELLARNCVGVAVQLEAVPATSLHALAQKRFTAPSPEALAIAQDRLRSKRMLRAIGLESAPFAEVLAAGDAMPTNLFPGILKTARNGRRGEGQERVAGARDLPQAWRRLGCVPCVLERKVSWDKELSVILVRADDGRLETYPVVENIHRGGVLEASVAPAIIPAPVTARAAAAAAFIAESLDHVGILAVEFFLRDEDLLVNEFALRPHDTGNFTLDACPASQFEQQVRALTGMPLAPAGMRCAAATVDVPQDAWDVPALRLIARAFNAGLHLHAGARPQAGLKVGHFIILDKVASRAARRAEKLRQALHGSIAARAA